MSVPVSPTPEPREEFDAALRIGREVADRVEPLIDAAALSPTPEPRKDEAVSEPEYGPLTDDATTTPKELVERLAASGPLYYAEFDKDGNNVTQDPVSSSTPDEQAAEDEARMEYGVQWETEPDVIVFGSKAAAEQAAGKRWEDHVILVRQVTPWRVDGPQALAWREDRFAAERAIEAVKAVAEHWRGFFRRDPNPINAAMNGCADDVQTVLSLKGFR